MVKRRKFLQASLASLVLPRLAQAAASSTTSQHAKLRGKQSVTNPDKIVGYCSKPSVRQGGKMQFMASTPAETFSARLVKLTRKSKEHQPVKSSLDGTYSGREQALVFGSYIRFDKHIPAPEQPTLNLYFRPLHLQRAETQALMCWDETHGLFINPEGQVEFRWGQNKVTSNASVQNYRWFEVSTSLDASSQTLKMTLTSLEFNEVETFEAKLTGKASKIDDDSEFCIAACLNGADVSHCFDGKIERPKVAKTNGKVIAEWDFSKGMDTDIAVNIRSKAFKGQLVNCPRRAMTGHNWTGEEMRFTNAPEQYGAIEFHADDLTDAKWEPFIEWDVPKDLKPGIYGVELEGAGGYECIYFVVRPQKVSSGAKVAFLLPTFSHLAYANERHWWKNPKLEAMTGGKKFEEIVLEADLWAAEQGLLSCYDLHKDGTGSCHSSWTRPIVNMRPGYVMPPIDGPHQLPGDLYISDWLDSIGEDFDVLTDHDLHAEGVDALKPYNVVLTGQHPEYVSVEIFDAIYDYTRDGGNLMYLGGQGFAVVVSTLPSDPNVMELRRGKKGIGAWYSEPGEHYQAADGKLGGPLASQAKEPHVVLGTGCAGVTFGKASSYYRTEEGKSSEYNWVFDGVKGDEIAAAGDLMGGPAGFEFDRVDYRRGSPMTTVRLATVNEFDGVAIFALPEDVPSTGVVLGEVRADLAMYTTPAGGNVFAASSIPWTACLFVDDGDNDVARITGNVLKRFATS